MLRFALMFALTTSTLAAAQSIMPVVTGAGQTYSALSTMTAWKSVDLPLAALSSLDRNTLSLSAPGLSLKLLGTALVDSGQALRLSVNVQQASGYRAGTTLFTLKDATGHALTFELPVY